MKRLLMICGLIASLGVAGCTSPILGTDNPSSSSQATLDSPPPTPTDTEENGMPEIQFVGYEEPTGYEWNAPANSTTERITIGAAGENQTGFEPHSYTIWNSDNTSHTVNITVVNRSGIVQTATVSIAPNATVELALRRPDDFAITIVVFNGSAPVSRVEINDDSNNFDCNAKGGQLAILTDGRMTATTFSTMVACPDEIDPIQPEKNSS